MNGGAWLQVDEVAVDLIYRDLDEVLAWTAQAERGRFEIQRDGDLDATGRDLIELLHVPTWR